MDICVCIKRYPSLGSAIMLTDDGMAIEYASPRLQVDPEIQTIARTQLRYGASAEGGVVAF